MIKSNMNEMYRNTYISYISSRYQGVWWICTKGDVVFPVIGLSSVERIFGITIDKAKVPLRRMKPSGYEEYCDIQEEYYNKEQFDAIAFLYKLRDRRSYRDLLVAHDLEMYNNSIINELSVWAEDMYDAVQLHHEFCEALQAYLVNNFDDSFSINDSAFSINVNPENEICYKELIDYAHYKGQKPAIGFKIVLGGKSKKGQILPDDYEMQFEETSYKIRIKNIQFS